MAPPATQGGICQRVLGNSTPAASGIIIALYLLSSRQGPASALAVGGSDGWDEAQREPAGRQ